MVRVGKTFKSINSIVEGCLLQLAFPVLSASENCREDEYDKYLSIKKRGQSERACITSSVCLAEENNL